MLTTRAFILRRTIHTASRLRAPEVVYDKGGDETLASTSKGRTYVVAEPLENEKPYGVPAGVYTSGEPMTDTSVLSSSMPHSSTSSSPPHPKTTEDAMACKLPERNAWPSEEQGKMGRDEAAKHRR